MLGFLFGSTKVNEDLEALLKSIQEIEKEIEDEKKYNIQIIILLNLFFDISYKFLVPQPTRIHFSPF